ncbi:hypothetical protein ASPNIDRAFT_125440, partial [Aspergillus niger ATCC 1015]
GMGYPNLAPGLDMSILTDTEDGNEWAEAIVWIGSVTILDIWLKGIYTADDVALAIHHGVNSVLISNHGGKQLNGVPATVDALRECTPVAKGEIMIANDGGIRRGRDIFKIWP